MTIIAQIIQEVIRTTSVPVNKSLSDFVFNLACVQVTVFRYLCLADCVWVAVFRTLAFWFVKSPRAPWSYFCAEIPSQNRPRNHKRVEKLALVSGAWNDIPCQDGNLLPSALPDDVFLIPS